MTIILRIDHYNGKRRHFYCVVQWYLSSMIHDIFLFIFLKTSIKFDECVQIKAWGNIASKTWYWYHSNAVGRYSCVFSLLSYFLPKEIWWGLMAVPVVDMGAYNIIDNVEPYLGCSDRINKFYCLIYYWPTLNTCTTFNYVPPHDAMLLLL